MSLVILDYFSNILMLIILPKRYYIMNDQFYHSFFIFHKEYLDNKGSKIISMEKRMIILIFQN